MPQARPAPFTGETQPPRGTPWLVPAQEASKLEHFQIYDTGLTAPQTPRTAGPAPDSSLGAHRTARRRLPDRGVSATPDCPLHRNIYLFSHSTLELQGASAPPPPEAGQEVQRTQPGWGQPNWQGLGARAPPCSQRSLSHPTEAHLCPSLSVPVLGWGGGRETLLGINFTLWIWLLICLLPLSRDQPRDSNFLFLQLLSCIMGSGRA